MNLNLKKNPVVGVSVNPERGLEVVQVDFEHKHILKYGRKDLEYDISNQEISDLDYFKETLHDLLIELDIPKGAEIVLNIPPLMFKVADYPTALGDAQIVDSILEDLAEHPVYKDVDLAVSVADAGVSTMQSQRITSAISKKTMLVEVAMQIKELGYRLIAIDVSVNSILNALLYSNSIDCSDDSIWLLLIVENGCCRIVTMQGNHYTDCFEEKLVIGEVLGEDENYKAVLETVNPILNNIPSQYLFVVSKTNLISAERLANSLNYKSTIIHYESNDYAVAPLLEVNPEIPEDLAKTISVDVIGAGIKKYLAGVECNINLFNEFLGNVYLSEKPLTIKINGKEIVCSVENMKRLSIILSVITLSLCFVTYVALRGNLYQKKAELNKLSSDIENMKAELKKNEDVSSEIFDEDSEIKMGLAQNKRIYSYYTIVGTEIPRKLWLTKLKFDETTTTIEGQADNLESIYAFYRNIKDYDTSSDLKLQKLELASKLKGQFLSDDIDKDSMLLTSMTADFYQFKISNAVEEKDDGQDSVEDANSEGENSAKESDDKKSNGKKNGKSDVPKFIPSSSLETAE